MAEPKDELDELLDDPIVQLLMRSDGVRPQEVRLLMRQARDRLPDLPVPPAHVVANACCGGLCA